MKRHTILLSLAAMPLIIGCGGGGTTTDTATTTSTASTATVSGTVPGTLIEAFCQDGGYYHVSSTDDGTSQHPFSLTLPTGTNCQLVMTTNENDPDNRVITPIGFEENGNNGTTLSLQDNINIGHISLALDPANIKDVDGDHVSDELLYVEINNSSAANINTTPVLDSNNNGIVDAYDDDDDDSIPNAYEDDDHDGRSNIHDDDNNDGTPDYIEDDDHDGIPNTHDDDNNDGTPDYIEDDDHDGIPNTHDDDNNNGTPDYIEDDDHDGIPNTYDDDDNNGTPDYIEDDDQENASDTTTTTPTTTTTTTATPTTTTTTSTSVSFANDVMPILTDQCKSCHGSNGAFTVTDTQATYANIMSLTGGATYMLNMGSGMNGHPSILQNGSTQYNTVKAWVDAGAVNN